ncbi:ATP-binding protein [Kitasatospora sp. NPDC058170]|uniref:ATP-binding protein n=1 Tax=Kitasatospora sp. NPDC058170 TaxID=3346364 RepID=UPI0036DE9DA7
MNDHRQGSGFRPPGDTAFVGRGDELRTLLETVARRPAVVFVEGEAGIGKSRLVREAAAVLGGRGVRVLTGTCHPLREPLPYGPVTDALRGIGTWLPPTGRLGPSAGALAPLLPDLAHRLPAPPEEAAEPGGRRHRLAAAVRTLLGATAPVALVVEDVHWADDATRELLLLLARDLPADSALVLTYRAEDLPAERPVLGAPYRRPPGTAGAEIALGPLGRAELRAMAREWLAREPAAALVRTLLRRSEGLPLIIEEDLITLAAHPADAGTAALRVPRSLREVMDERTAALSPDGQALAGAAAVLTRPADEAMLIASAALDETRGATALVEVLRAAVLRQRGPDTYGFAHDLAREAVYESLPGPVRNRHHRRILEVLQAQDPPPLVQIAHHTRALGDLAAWLPQAQAAADQAMEIGDDGTAATLFGAILEQPDLAPEQLAKAALSLATAARWSIAYTETIATLRRIVLLPGLPVPVRGEIRGHLGRMMLNQAQDPAGEEEVLTALSEVGDTNPTVAARLLGSLGISETARFSLAEQHALIERGRVLAATTGDKVARSVLEVAHYGVLGLQADPSSAAMLDALPREGDERIDREHVVVILSNSAEISLCVGHDERAAATVAEVLALLPDTHIPILTAYVHYYRIILDWLAGRWQDWERGLTACEADYPESPLWTHGLVATIRGLTAAARGHTAPAADILDRILAQEGARMTTLGAAAGAARLHLAQQHPEAAWESLCHPVDHLAFLRRKGAWPYAWDLVPTAVEVLLALGETRPARELADEHAAGTAGRDAPGAAAEQQLCRGLLLRTEDPGRARDCFERAAEGWRVIGRPYHAALAAEHAALTLPDPAEAADRLAGPLAVFDRLGATTDAARCRHHLRARGRDRPALPASPGRAGYGEHLSPREEQVRDLLATGASNKDIAAALFLSPRTVENHVARLLRKLGTTRADLTGHRHFPS